jgi:hypothetical protein
LYKSRHHRDRQPLRSCLSQTPPRPFISARAFAIYFLALGISSPSYSLAIHAPQSQRPSPCLLSIIPAASRMRANWTWCAAFWDGPRQSVLGGSVPAKSPSATLPQGSSFSSTRTPCVGCGLVPPISSFFLLLLEEFGLQLQHLTPTLSSSWRSSPILWRCSWGSVPAPPSSGIFMPWSGQGGAGARSAPATSSSGKGRPTPTSAPSPARSGRIGVTTGSSPRPTPTTAWSCQQRDPKVTGAPGRPGRHCRRGSTRS